MLPSELKRSPNKHVCKGILFEGRVDIVYSISIINPLDPFTSGGLTWFDT